eukprot:581511-Rhodomonas_salina.1
MYASMCASMCACMRAYISACMCAYMCASMWAGAGAVGRGGVPDARDAAGVPGAAARRLVLQGHAP